MYNSVTPLVAEGTSTKHSISYSNIMTLQMYLISKGLIQLEDLVISNFNSLKERVHEHKDVRCVATYLMACELFEVELSASETSDVKKLLKLIVHS